MSAAKPVIRVLVTGAAGQIAYSLLPLIANGDVFGAQQPIALNLFDIGMMKEKQEGVALELEDCMYPLVTEIKCTVDIQEAFTGVNYAILLGGFPRKPGMERRDLMAKNVPIFVEQGRALDQYAARDVKVLVVANPANTNCLILAMHAPSIPRTNFAAMTRLDLNRANYQIAHKLGVSCDKVHGVTIWGNHSKTMVPDIYHGTVTLNHQTSPLSTLLEEKWLDNDFIPVIQNRGAAIMNKRGLSSALSAAKAAADHVRDWFVGTPQGQHTSFGVWSDGSYGIAKDIIFSFPVAVHNGAYSIVQDLSVNETIREKLKETEKELIAEKQEALDAINAQQQQ